MLESGKGTPSLALRQRVVRVAYRLPRFTPATEPERSAAEANSMRHIFLVLGRIAAAIGCLASIAHVISSVAALFDRSRNLTDGMMCMPLFGVYGFLINAALFVVFGRVCAMKPGRK